MTRHRTVPNRAAARQARRGAAGLGEDPRPGGGGARLPAPALRRAAPARDGGDGAGQRPAAAALRRADHRAGRDGAAPGAGPCLRPGARARHRAAVHHPRPGRRGEHVHARAGPEPGADRRVRPDGAGLLRPGPSLHPRPAGGQRPGGHRRARAAVHGRHRRQLRPPGSRGGTPGGARPRPETRPRRRSSWPSAPGRRRGRCRRRPR